MSSVAHVAHVGGGVPATSQEKKVATVCFAVAMVAVAAVACFAMHTMPVGVFAAFAVVGGATVVGVVASEVFKKKQQGANHAVN